jgi:hypothetical protein
MSAGTGLLVVVLLAGGAGLVFYLSKSTKPPITAVVQAPSPAVAGINALGLLAGKGLDAWIASRVNKSSD